MSFKKFLISVLAVLFLLSIKINSFASDVPTSYRTWTYLNLNFIVAPGWAWTVLTSHAYEYKRDNDVKDNKGWYFAEFFTGPVYVKKFDNLTVKLPLWYYYQAFPIRAAVSTTGKDEYCYAHNIEFLPIIEYKIGNFKIWNRIIFHNKIYSSFYSTFMNNSDLNKGYSLLIREYLRFEYSLNRKLTLMIGDEIFYGVIEDDDTKDITPAPLTPGFEYGGFCLNRLYVGFSYKITPTIAFTPMYMYQTQYFDDSDTFKVTGKDHYLFSTLTFLIKTF